MLVSVLHKTEGSVDAYGDPALTWTEYRVLVTTIHPDRRPEQEYHDFGVWRRKRYQVTFHPDVDNIEYVLEGNRIIISGEQYEIVVRDNWWDSEGNTIRVYTLVERALDSVSYS